MQFALFEDVQSSNKKAAYKRSLTCRVTIKFLNITISGTTPPTIHDTNPISYADYSCAVLAAVNNFNTK